MKRWWLLTLHLSEFENARTSRIALVLMYLLHGFYVAGLNFN